jgi:hypothetical protein
MKHTCFFFLNSVKMSISVLPPQPPKAKQSGKRSLRKLQLLSKHLEYDPVRTSCLCFTYKKLIKIAVKGYEIELITIYL